MINHAVQLFDRVASRHRLLVVFLAVLLLTMVASVDYVTSYQMRFSLFYLLPVALMTWYLGTTHGLLWGLLSSLVATLVNKLSGEPLTNALIPLWNISTRVVFYGVVVVLLGQLRITLERERRFARRDALTGLANQREFEELAKRELDRCRRYHHPLTVAYLDCDNLKATNDQFGHHAGDALLRLVGLTLQVHLRASDIAARLGGDEFAVLFPETDQHAAEEIIDRTRRELDRRMDERGWPASFSAGVVAFQEAPESVETLLRQADALQ